MLQLIFNKGANKQTKKRMYLGKRLLKFTSVQKLIEKKRLQSIMIDRKPGKRSII